MYVQKNDKHKVTGEKKVTLSTRLNAHNFAKRVQRKPISGTSHPAGLYPETDQHHTNSWLQVGCGI